MCGKYESINYMRVTQDPNSDTILSSGERNGKFCQNGKLGQNGNVHLSLNVSSYNHNCGCIVDGSNAMAAVYQVEAK